MLKGEHKRSIDYKFFRVGAIWYVSKHFRETGFFRIVGKNSQGVRILHKIAPNPISRENYNGTIASISIYIDCKSLRDGSSYRPISSMSKRALEVLYGNPEIDPVKRVDPNLVGYPNPNTYKAPNPLQRLLAKIFNFF